MNEAKPYRSAGNRHDCRPEAVGWNPATRSALQNLIRRGSGKQLPVVFDFDNTIVSGDIGEATLAVLARSGRLTPGRLPPTLCPPFRPAGKRRVALASCGDVAEYYEAFLAPTAHGTSDRTPLANGYAWATEVMENLSPLEVIHATRSAFEWDQPEKPGYIEVTPGKTAFAVPRFYPEIVELIAALLRHRFAVWIISASNVWSVRWMVLHALNPLLRQHSRTLGLPPDRVIGISTLLADRAGRLHKDAILVREQAGYAALDEKVLRGFRLTSRLQFPVPTYSGKIAAVFDALRCNPYLGVGDSPGDLPMLAVSRHRLWLARLEKPIYQRAALEMIRRTGRSRWMVQPTLSRPAPGFLPRLSEVPRRWPEPPPQVAESLRILAPVNRAPSRGASKHGAPYNQPVNSVQL